MNEIKLFLKNGYTKFFGQEKNNDKISNINEADSFCKEYLSTESSFYSRNQNNNNNVIYKNNSSEKKYFKVTVINNNSNNIKNIKLNNSKEDLKEYHLQHIKKVQSLNNFPSYSTQTYNSNNPFK